jgi:small subunit ribosomal protein S3
MKLRVFNHRDDFFGFLGFKVHLRGRFSRKQKASSIRFFKGTVPLNTLKASIDYGFYTIPLKNSLISVKVWFYKTELFEK